jgi:hypothetical protein
MISENNTQYLEAMEVMGDFAQGLKTTAYIWGGLSLDIYAGQFLREHSDIDYVIQNLQKLAEQFVDRFCREGWHVRRVLDDSILVVKKDGIKLHLGHIDIAEIVQWKHNGNNGTITFPVHWLRQEPVEFFTIKVHVVEPEFGYVLKSHPQLMNPEWKPRDRDLVDMRRFAEILSRKQVDVTKLLPQVTSISQ